MLVRRINAGKRDTGDTQRQAGVQSVFDIASNIQRAPEPRVVVTAANALDRLRIAKTTFRERELLSAAAVQSESQLPILHVRSITLRVMDATSARDFAVAQVTPPDAGALKTDVTGGPDDPHFGVLRPDELCSTCHLTNMSCPGHFGYIELQEKFLHPMFATDAVCILQCVCNSCSSLLVGEQFIKERRLDRYHGRARWKAIAEYCINGSNSIPCTKEHRCRKEHHCECKGEQICTISPHCDCSRITKCVPNPKYDITKMKDCHTVTYTASTGGTSKRTKKEDGGKKEKPVDYRDSTGVCTRPSVKTIDEILSILTRISNEDALLLGFEAKPNKGTGVLEMATHPRNLVMQILPVLPPCARPYMIIAGQKHEDQLTCMYRNEITSANTAVMNAKAKALLDHSSLEIQQTTRDLWFKISHLMDNHDGRVLGRAKEPVLGIKQRLVRKDGYIRRFNMGKAVNFCGRTVIGPMSELRFGQVGFPQIMREGLTIPEKVHYRNREYLQALYEMGEILFIYPGSDDYMGRRYAVNDHNRTRYPKLSIGDTVERRMRGHLKLVDGQPDQTPDVVLFNRQPTLSKNSIRGHQIMTVNRRTFGVHMGDTKSLNADFDGDEGNTHAIQTIESRVEAMTFVSATANIMSATTNSPIVGVVYNGLSSCYIMTQDNVTLTDEEWEEAITTLTNPPDWGDFDRRCTEQEIDHRSGRALFSTLLPPDLWYERKNDDDNFVEIRNGILTKGIITKSNIGVSSRTIQQTIWKNHGPERTATFITDCTFLADWFIWNNGFSIGYGDLEIPDSDLVRKNIDKCQNEVRLNIHSLPEVTEDTTEMELEHREAQICTWVNTANNIGKKINKEQLRIDNPLNIMLFSGAKGSSTNTSQIAGMIGQVNVKGGRPVPKMSNGQRVIPYFYIGDKDIRAFGFCTSSFMMGLDPAELVFTAFATRIGLTDTAVSTAEVGYMHHRMVKVMEDVSSRYDGSVRNADGAIMLFSYGPGYNAAEMVETKSNLTGSVVSFCDLKSIVGRINQQYGYTGKVSVSRF